MPARLLRLLLSLGLAFTALGTAIGLGAFIHGSVVGAPLHSTWQVVTDRPTTDPVVLRAGGAAAGAIAFDRGQIDIRAGSAVYRLLQGLDILVAGGLWIAIFWLARRLVADVAGGRPFERRNIVRLRHIGLMLVALEIWTIVEALILQPLLLADIRLADPGARLLPSIAQGVAGARNIRVDFHLDTGLLVVGLLLIVIAAAFETGRRLAEDNEAIV